MTSYSTHLDVKFAPLELIDIQALVGACTDSWYNQTLCEVNDAVVRLGVLHGEFPGTRTRTRTSSSSSWTEPC